ncbi:hypothetical protein [Leptospira levettii]|uniref:hypothetical protein n=1 Tax=Leptospira levettii TaxID=2023178 RepID=UPI00223D21CD|nr:hypothetical protein [Leptospira levettii]MCW7473347.1 hypothetical protein [Leptospira levettii]
MKNLRFLQSRFQRITNVSISIWKLLWSKGWSFFLLYTILYFIHCFTSWDKLKLANIQIELEMVSRYGSVSFWQLYPFQIVSIYFLYLLYFCFSIVLVFLYLKFRSSKEPNKLFQLTKKMTQSFFFSHSLFVYWESINRFDTRVLLLFPLSLWVLDCSLSSFY